MVCQQQFGDKSVTLMRGFTKQRREVRDRTGQTRMEKL